MPSGRPAPALTCEGTREPRGPGRSPLGCGAGSRGRGRRFSAPGGCSPRSRAFPPAPWPPAAARFPCRQARDPAGRGAGLPLSTHRRPAAAGRRRRQGLENSGCPPLESSGSPAGVRGVAGPLPLAPAVVSGAASWLEAHPGPSPAGARAEAGEARQHPLMPARREEPTESGRGALHCESLRGAGGSGATRAPGPGRRAAPLLPSLPPRSRRPLGKRVPELGRVGGEAPRSRPRTRARKGEKGEERRRARVGGAPVGLRSSTLRLVGGDCCVVGGGQKGWANQRFLPAGPLWKDKSRVCALPQVRRTWGNPVVPSSAAASFRARRGPGRGFGTSPGRGARDLCPRPPWQPKRPSAGPEVSAEGPAVEPCS